VEASGAVSARVQIDDRIGDPAEQESPNRPGRDGLAVREHEDEPGDEKGSSLSRLASAGFCSQFDL